MIKFLIILIFLIPLSFYLNFWIIILFIIFLTFLFLINISITFQFEILSYMFRYDLLSYSLILLRFWICILILMPREKGL